jgi:phage shock protein PspC (stress-responsive transcriptional regulator)
MEPSSSVGAPGAVPPPPPPAPGPRRLRRRPDEGHIAGVCAGVAEYFAIDPLLVRIAAVVLLFSGPGFIAYVLMWIFVPAEPGHGDLGSTLRHVDRKDRATQVFGIVLLGLGVSVIWGDWWSPARGWLFPLALVGVGAWLLLRPDDDEDDDRGALPPIPPVPPMPPVPPTPPALPPLPWPFSSPAAGATTQDVSGEPGAEPDPAPTSADDTLVEGEVDGAADPTTEQPTPQAGGSGGWDGGDPPTAPWDVPPSPAPGPGSGAPAAVHEDHRHRPRRHRHRRVLGPSVFGVLLVWVGIAWLAGTGLTTGLAVGLVIIGLGFVFGSFVGGSRALIFPALIVAAALAVTATIDIPLNGPIGEQRWSPDDRAELQDVYEVSMGEGTLDLSDLPIPDDEELSVRATVGLGHLVVLVAEGEPVFVHAKAGAGELVVFGEERNGVEVDLHESFGGQEDGEGLVLELEVGMGQVEVRRVESGSSAVDDLR